MLIQNRHITKYKANQVRPCAQNYGEVGACMNQQSKGEEGDDRVTYLKSKQKFEKGIRERERKRNGERREGKGRSAECGERRDLNRLNTSAFKQEVFETESLQQHENEYNI